MALFSDILLTVDFDRTLTALDAHYLMKKNPQWMYKERLPLLRQA